MTIFNFNNIDLKARGERLRYIFDVLSRHKRKFEKISLTRALRSEEHEQYKSICSKLTNFMDKCKNFIRLRKNGIGKFSVDDYVKWYKENNSPTMEYNFSNIVNSYKGINSMKQTESVSSNTINSYKGTNAKINDAGVINGVNGYNGNTMKSNEVGVMNGVNGYNGNAMKPNEAGPSNMINGYKVNCVNHNDGEHFTPGGTKYNEVSGSHSEGFPGETKNDESRNEEDIQKQDKKGIFNKLGFLQEIPGGKFYNPQQGYYGASPYGRYANDEVKNKSRMGYRPPTGWEFQMNVGNNFYGGVQPQFGMNERRNVRSGENEGKGGDGYFIPNNYRMNTFVSPMNGNEYFCVNDMMNGRIPYRKQYVGNERGFYPNMGQNGMQSQGINIDVAGMNLDNYLNGGVPIHDIVSPRIGHMNGYGAFRGPTPHMMYDSRCRGKRYGGKTGDIEYPNGGGGMSQKSPNPVDGFGYGYGPINDNMYTPKGNMMGCPRTAESMKRPIVSEFMHDVRTNVNGNSNNNIIDNGGYLGSNGHGSNNLNSHSGSGSMNSLGGNSINPWGGNSINSSIKTLNGNSMNSLCGNLVNPLGGDSFGMYGNHNDFSWGNGKFEDGFGDNIAGKFGKISHGGKEKMWPEEKMWTEEKLWPGKKKQWKGENGFEKSFPYVMPVHKTTRADASIFDEINPVMGPNELIGYGSARGYPRNDFEIGEEKISQTDDYMIGTNYMGGCASTCDNKNENKCSDKSTLIGKFGTTHIVRPELSNLCENRNIEISSSVKDFLFIHGDAVIHKVLMLAGEMASYRITKYLKLEDIKVIFDRVINGSFKFKAPSLEFTQESASYNNKHSLDFTEHNKYIKLIEKDKNMYD